MKKVYETDRFEYYKNSTTEYWNKELEEVDRRGVSLRDHFCLIAVNKVMAPRSRWCSMVTVCPCSQHRTPTLWTSRW